jgi:hypothetical protein
MRSMILAALVAATTISVASAEDLSTQAPPPSGAMIDNLPGISPQQEAAIPYTPCCSRVTLDRLARGGFVVARPLGTDSVQYRITQRGRDAIVEHDL